jgi:hypothetical protein
MSAEQRLSPVQPALFPQESDLPTDQNTYRDQITRAYVALYQKRLSSDELTPPTEEMILGTQSIARYPPIFQEAFDVHSYREVEKTGTDQENYRAKGYNQSNC